MMVSDRGPRPLGVTDTEAWRERMTRGGHVQPVEHADLRDMLDEIERLRAALREAMIMLASKKGASKKEGGG